MAAREGGSGIHRSLFRFGSQCSRADGTVQLVLEEEEAGVEQPWVWLAGVSDGFIELFGVYLYLCCTLWRYYVRGRCISSMYSYRSK